MSKRRLRSTRPSSPETPTLRTPDPPAVANPHAAGIDVHSDNHVVCVGPGLVTTFGAYTCDLHAIVAHLRAHQVTAVALESTGVYWIPLFELLEAEGFAVALVEPGQLRNCGARPKTDVLDCQWIQRLHTYGLLRGSFRPPASIQALRAYQRQRLMLVRYAASHVQHMQKALTQMNVKLTEVLSDIAGMSGMAIINALVDDGVRDPRALAELAWPNCATPKAEIARALEGTWQREHLIELQIARDLYRSYHHQITRCDQEIEAELGRLPDRSKPDEFPAKKRRSQQKKNDLRFEATGPLFRALGVDLTAIEGIEVKTALIILAEIGVDVSRFPTEKHFASWLGLSPNPSQSNRQSRAKPRRGSGPIKRALRMCAESVGRTQTPLGAFYRRIRSRIGGRGACTATAHKLARLVYRMLRHGEAYVTRGMDEYAARMKEQAERSLRRRASAMGFEVVPKVDATAA